MTEAEWFRCLEPQKMADYLSDINRGSGRKCRLFVCACVRRIWHLLTDERLRLAVELSEQAADGLVTDKYIEDAWLDWIDQGDFGSGGDAGIAALAATGVSARWDWEDAHDYAVSAVAGTDAEVAVERQTQGDLMRCIMGNPFRPIGLCATRVTPGLLSLAQTAYVERHPGSGYLAPSRLAVLADALEEAGCSEQAVLDHLRSPGPHVRGCWPVDLVLAKE